MSFTITGASLDGYSASPEHPVLTEPLDQRPPRRRRAVEELEAENARLTAENERLLEDRELLVTTVGIVVSM